MAPDPAYAVQISFWNYVGVVNILTDVTLILLCFALAWNIQISFKRRLVVAGFFSPRVLVVAAIIVQLVYANRAFHRQELTYSTWQLVLSTQFVQNLSVETACIPIKILHNSFETESIRNDHQRRQHTERDYSPNNGKFRFPDSMRTNLFKASSRVRGTVFSNKKAHELDEHPHHHRGDERFFQSVMTNVATVRGGERDLDAESESSRSQFVRMTRTWTVESEPRI